LNYLELGEIHSTIWWNHDNKRFNLVEKNALELLLKLGFDKNQSIKASKTIKQSYKEYDKALKTKNFKLMNNKHKQTMQILGFPQENGEKYSKWWINFSERNYPKIIKSLFTYHLAFFRKISKLLTPLPVLLLILAGIGHNTRNKRIAKTFLTLYWLTILTQGKKKFILY